MRRRPDPAVVVLADMDVYEQIEFALLELDEHERVQHRAAGRTC